MQIEALWRYPLKGMAGESCSFFDLAPNMGIPGDRQFALMRADRPFADIAQWALKRHFMHGMYTTLLSQITIRWQTDAVRFDYGDEALELPRPLDQTTALCDWLAHLDSSLPQLSLVNHVRGWADVSQPVWSMINPSTVQAIADATGTPFSMARYRGNAWLNQVAPFEELNWVGRIIECGAVRCRVVEPIVRCKATEVNWLGSRDLGFLDQLETISPDLVCGIYLETLSSGRLHLGDSISIGSVPTD